MSTIGRFEILDEISTSANGCVYKANDPESKQVVALKTLRLEVLGERAPAILQQFFDEAEGTKSLNSPNIALLYGAGDIDGQFCGAMEYVQGKSIAGMLSQGDGFSIWDIQDIARQACQGLDHAHARKVVHCSLEPGKLMVQWDGTVKILGFGISSLSLYSSQGAGTSPLLHYMSPEHVRGETLDARSNLFSLGAIIYEMATGRHAFEGETEEAVKQQIVEGVPAPPHEVNKKISTAVSEVILKALAKNPDERYQSGQEMVSDLERHRHSAGKSTAAAKPAKSSAKADTATPQEARPEAAQTHATRPERRAKAAAASGSGQTTASAKSSSVDPTEQFISSCIKASMEAIAAPEQMSAAAATSKPEAPAFADPLMAGEAGNSRSKSFSEVDELPPLKEAYVGPPVAAEPDPLQELREPHFKGAARTAPAKAPSKELAKKAVREISKTPPKLFLYSIGAAVAIIALVVGFIASRISSQTGEESSSAPASAVQTASDAGATSQSIAAAASKPPSAAPQSAPDVADGKSTFISVKPKITPKKAVKAAAPVAVLVPGQLNVHSTPEGAQIVVDGQGDTAWVTPFEVTGLPPGPHIVTVSKAGFTPETRTIEVASKSKSFLVIQLAQLPATILVAAEPPGAQILLDGKDTGRVTPSQLKVENPGSHTVLVRKQGYLDESTTLNLQAGQSLRFAPQLRQLGATDDIKTTGKIKKLFGGGPDGMAKVTVKTQPKNAQVAVNRRILDKNSPVEFYLNPGTYVVDITLTGYKSVQRVINVEKDGKMAIEEALERQ